MLLLGAMAVMSLIAFVAMGTDKLKAKQGAWRIPERVLFSLAFLLGAPGAYAGMMVFRHKTLHKRFSWGVPAMLVFQATLLACLLIHYA